MRTGWFKFHRQIFDNPVCTKDAEYFFVWCYILSEAAYEESRVLFKNEEIILSKGQLLTTVKDIALNLNLSESKVNRIIKKLEIEKQIEKRSSSKNTLITVLNWERYQSSEEQNEEPVKNLRQTSEKPVKNKRQTDGKPSYYNKNIRIKEDKKERKEEGKNINTPPISPSNEGELDKPKSQRKEPVVYYPNDELLDSAFKEFLTMRNKIKKPIATKQAMTRIMNKLEKLSKADNDLAIKILNQSTDHCWQDVYELKEEKQRNKRTVFDEWRDA